eukprot:2155858-Pleurochrysis_carterae.AAC.6
MLWIASVVKSLAQERGNAAHFGRRLASSLANKVKIGGFIVQNESFATLLAVCLVWQKNTVDDRLRWSSASRLGGRYESRGASAVISAWSVFGVLGECCVDGGGGPKAEEQT